MHAFLCLSAEVRAVKLATSRLEQLHPEIVPAVAAVWRHHGNVAAIRNLKSLVQDWETETTALVQALDAMTDPTVFLSVTGQSPPHAKAFLMHDEALLSSFLF